MFKGGEHGAAGERLLARAEELGNVDDLPIPLASAAVMSAHHRLSEGLIGMLSDLDELPEVGPGDRVIVPGYPVMTDRVPPKLVAWLRTAHRNGAELVENVWGDDVT